VKPALVILTLLLLASCRSVDSTKKSQADEEWFDRYYGTYKSEEQKEAESWCKFYGTCPKDEKEDEDMCKFYGTCPKDEKDDEDMCKFYGTCPKDE